MEYTKEKRGDELHVTVSGRLDTETAPKFQSELSQDLTGVASIFIDFSGVEYISSSGLRALLYLKKQIPAGTVAITNANDSIKSIFTMSGFDAILRIN